MVVIMSITFVLFAPAASEVGENDAEVFAGSVEVEKVMVPARVPFHGATARVKLAGWPATTAMAATGAPTLKSATVIMRAELVAPTGGGGLFTVILNVPLAVKSLAGSVTVSEVELTEVGMSGVKLPT